MVAICTYTLNTLKSGLLNVLSVKGIKAEYINDDALGRCLDKLYETGVSDIYQTLYASVVEHLGLPCEGINLDSTSIHVDGKYDQNDDSQAVRLVLNIEGRNSIVIDCMGSIYQKIFPKSAAECRFYKYYHPVFWA